MYSKIELYYAMVSLSSSKFAHKSIGIHEEFFNESLGVEIIPKFLILMMQIP